MSVRLSVGMEQLGSHSTDFLEIWYLSTDRKSVEKTQVLLKYDEDDVYFTWKRVYIYDDISLNAS
jgi:hypothetical protein